MASAPHYFSGAERPLYVNPVGRPAASASGLAYTELLPRERTGFVGEGGYREKTVAVYADRHADERGARLRASRFVPGVGCA